MVLIICGKESIAFAFIVCPDSSSRFSPASGRLRPLSRRPLASARIPLYFISALFHSKFSRCVGIYQCRKAVNEVLKRKSFVFPIVYGFNRDMSPAHLLHRYAVLFPPPYGRQRWRSHKRIPRENRGLYRSIHSFSPAKRRKYSR